MNNYDAAERELTQWTNTFGFDIGLINELIEAYNTQSQGTTLIFYDVNRHKANIDLYLNNPSSPTVYGFDLRRLPAVPQ